jgi:hypothetical protein
MASRMAGDGNVTVSLRRSIIEKISLSLLPWVALNEKMFMGYGSTLKNKKVLFVSLYSLE